MLNHKTLGALLVTLLLSIALFTAQADARQGWYVGGGFASVSASGDLDGSNNFENAAGTDAVVAGSLSNGTGYVFDAGYGFNKYVGIEYLYTRSHHSASNNLGLSDSSADVSTGLLGAKFTYPLEDKNLELFARLGLSSHTVEYADYAFSLDSFGNITGSGKATFTGQGTGFGIGTEWMLDHLGIGVGYTVYKATFDKASGIHFSGGLSPTLKETFSELDVTAAYHF